MRRSSRCVPSTWLDQRDVLQYHWSGGGGYGDPIDRDPESVRLDLASGSVTPEVARDLYGVVTSRDGMSIDLESTERLRSEIRVKRLA